MSLGREQLYHILRMFNPFNLYLTEIAMKINYQLMTSHIY